MAKAVLIVQGIKLLPEIFCGWTQYVFPSCFRMHRSPWLAGLRQWSSSLKIWISALLGAMLSVMQISAETSQHLQSHLQVTTTSVAISLFFLGKANWTALTPKSSPMSTSDVKEKKGLECKRMKITDADFSPRVLI